MENKNQYETMEGMSQPYGVSHYPDGVNFALFSRGATSVTLQLFAGHDSIAEYRLDPDKNKSGNVWHILVKGLPKEATYSYRIEGPEKPLPSDGFDSSISLLDPYAKAVSTSTVWGQNISFEDAKEKKGYAPKGVVFVDEQFDWEGVKNPSIPTKDLIIYEMHVRGFTHHPSSNVQNKGKFLGIIEKIPYLLDLGINAIELLPIQEFNETEYPRMSPKSKQMLYNYWGYSTVNFFSLMNRYAQGEEPGVVVKEFKTMVRELHRNGIEVILDVVFNHTSEALGQTLSYRGIENSTYYIVDGEGKYQNFTGCGNTFNCNHPVGRELIQDCLRYLVTELHVDGFRFDLASILTRDMYGAPLGAPPLIEALTLDPILSTVKLIAEPWDVGGLYQVGGFYPLEARWAEWNGKYRDNVRRFIKGNPYEKQLFATRLSGSQDLYGNGRTPLNSINFIVAHDGFSLADLVSYNEKHNVDNAEDNRDGLNENDSWNCGVEGPSINKKILALRSQQMRNLHFTLMISQGIPMMLMGDEYGHTRKGNNNTWGHDDELNWFLWDQIDTNADFFNFYKNMIHFRKSNPLLRRGTFVTPEDTEWHGLEPLKPNWGADDRFVTLTLKDRENGNDIYIALNASHVPITLTIPNAPEGKCWKRIVDTHACPPMDFIPEEKAPIVNGNHYRLLSYSSILLKAL